MRTDGQSPHGPGVETHEEDRRQPGRFRRETGRIGQACAKGKNSAAKLKATAEGVTATLWPRHPQRTGNRPRPDVADTVETRFGNDESGEGEPRHDFSARHAALQGAAEGIHLINVCRGPAKYRERL